MINRLKLKSPAQVILCLSVMILAIFSSFVILPLDLFIPSVCIAVMLSWASFIDIERHILPNILNYTLIGLGAAWVSIFRFDDLLHHFIGLISGYSVLWLVNFVHLKRTGLHGMGMGDAKLFAAAGMWLGWMGLPSVLLIGALSGLIFAGWKALRKGSARKEVKIAFGPHIALGFWMVWLMGPIGLNHL